MRSPLTTVHPFEVFGRIDPELLALSTRSCDWTVLSAADFPFVQDGRRRDAHFRCRPQAWYQQQQAGIPHLFAIGRLADRLRLIASALGG